MDRCEKLMTADGKNLSAVLCGENGEMSTQQNQLRRCHRCGCAGGRDPGKLQPEKIEAEICKSSEEYLK